MNYMHRGLPCSKGMVVSVALGICYPPSSSDTTSCSCGKTPTTTGHRRFHVDGGRSRISSSGTSRGPTVNVFTLMVGAPRFPAPAPLGARRRRFDVDGGRSRTFNSGTSRGSIVDVFTLMVGAPGSWGLTVDVFTLMVGSLGPSAPTPPGGPPSTFSR
jgi:hypothetical protein